MNKFIMDPCEKESLYKLYLYTFNRQDSAQRKKFFMERVAHGKVFRIKEDHIIVSELYRLPFKLNLKGQIYRLGGIGDVMTYPECADNMRRNF